MFIHFTDSEGDQDKEECLRWRCVNLNQCQSMKIRERENDQYSIEILFETHTLNIVCENIGIAKQTWNNLHGDFGARHITRFIHPSHLHHLSYTQNKA